MNSAFAYAFKHETSQTTGGSQIGTKNVFGHFSTILRFLMSKVTNLNSCFEKNDGNEPGSGDSSVKQIPIHNHERAANKGNITKLAAFERVFGFWKFF